jgi:hypothetical protein
MNKYNRTLICFAMAAALFGCLHKNIPPLTAEQSAITLAMPPLEAPSKISRSASVFGPAQEFVGSPLGDVGREGLSGVHSPESNQIALLKNGDESFAARVQLLEGAEKSIRIQAMIFWGDESGLYIAEILKKKKAEGLDVRVIVDAAANLGLQTQWTEKHNEGRRSSGD